MKQGHVYGTKQERKGHNWIFQTPEYEAEIQRLEAEWAAHATQQPREDDKQ